MGKQPPKYLVNMWLRDKREEHSWTQADVAEQIGVTEKTVSRWERGQAFPTPYCVQKLCTLFNATPQELGLDQARKHPVLSSEQEEMVSTPVENVSPDREPSSSISSLTPHQGRLIAYPVLRWSRRAALICLCMCIGLGGLLVSWMFFRLPLANSRNGFSFNLSGLSRTPKSSEGKMRLTLH